MFFILVKLKHRAYAKTTTEHDGPWSVNQPTFTSASPLVTVKKTMQRGLNLTETTAECVSSNAARSILVLLTNQKCFPTSFTSLLASPKKNVNLGTTRVPTL